MLFRLEPRGHRSTFWVYASPLLALALTLIASALVFEAMGRSPGLALYTFFIKPLTSPSSLPELLVKAAPLILIGIGLSLGFRANVWNIGAEGQYTMGALAGGGLALLFYDSTSPLLLPAMILAGVAGRHGLGRHPRLPAHALQRQRDPDQPDADLCRAADPDLSRHRPLARSGRLRLSPVAPLLRGRHHADPGHRHAPASRHPHRGGRRAAGLGPARQVPRGLSAQGRGPGAAGGALCRLQG